MTSTGRGTTRQTFLTGQPHRVGHLHDALVHIAGHEGSWPATGSEILDHYRSLPGPG